MEELPKIDHSMKCQICGIPCEKQEGQDDPSKYACIGCLKDRLEYLERTTKVRQFIDKKRWRQERKDIEILRSKLKGFI